MAEMTNKGYSGVKSFKETVTRVASFSYGNECLATAHERVAHLKLCMVVEVACLYHSM